MYYLDFATIIQLLKEFHRSGILQTKLPKGIVNTPDICWIRFQLLQGDIMACQIVTKRGEIFTPDKKMLRQLEKFGPLEWTFEQLKESSTSPMRALESNSSSTALSVPDSPSRSLSVPQRTSFLLAFVPRRLIAAEHYPLNVLTRQQRRVLALVDSRRNIGQIVTLLFSSASNESGMQEVLTILQQLEALNIVALR